MLLLLFYTFTTVVTVNCIGVEIGNETDNGQWSKKYDLALELKMDGKIYLFALSGYDWFIKELLHEGMFGAETDKGVFIYYYIKGFAYNIQGTQFLFAITESKYWFIQEVLTGGRMGKEISKGYWDIQPAFIFPVNVNREYFVLTVSSQNWHLKKLTADGHVGEETDGGKCEKKYNLGFPFSINGRQFIYLTDTARWIIREIHTGGKMKGEITSGNCQKKPIQYYPFTMRGKQYYYGLNDSKKDWFIQEFLPTGKMGKVKAVGQWEDFYHLSCPFKVDGIQYMYFLNENNYVIRKIQQIPRFCPILRNPKSYCNEESTLKYKVLYPRIERVMNYGGSSDACTEFTFITEYISEIATNDYYKTVKVTDSKNAIKSYSVLNKSSNQSIQLTVTMNAEIHEKHLTHKKQTEPQAVLDQVQKLESTATDKAGHLLAPSLGGVLEPYNFVPQSPMINRKLLVQGNSIRVPQQGWFNVERLIYNYVSETGGYVDWYLVISYGNLANSLRPTEFWLLVKLYDADGKLTNWGMNKDITGYHFRNVPTEACQNLTSTWWNIPY